MNAPSRPYLAVFEADLDWAFRLLSQFTHRVDPGLMLQVAQLAEKTEPERAIELYQSLVKDCIAQKQRSAYQAAIPQLKKIKHLYEVLNRPQNWQTYLQQLRAQYRNLSALQDEIHRAKL